MKNICMKAMAGLAMASVVTGADGQVTFNIVASQSIVDTTVTSSFTLSVFVEATFGTHIENAGFDLLYSGPALAIGDISPGRLPWDTTGSLGSFQTNGDFLGYSIGQVINPPVFLPDPASSVLGNPVLVGNFIVDLDLFGGVFGTAVWSTAGGVSGNGAVSIFDQTTGNFMQFRQADPGVIAGSVSVTFVPAPSSLGVLGVGGLVVGRRRRSLLLY